jgi:HlyD family secretion protein
MRRSVKWGIGLSVVGVIAVISIVNAARSESGVEVRIEDVQSRDLVSVVNASGWIRPNRKVDVQSDIMGRITRMHVKEGQLVKRGDTLLQIDPTQSRAAVERARGALSEAQARAAQTNANFVQAQRNADRMRQLASVDSGLVSRQDLEEAETQELVQKELYDASQFGVAQARASLNEAIDRLGKTVLQAPIDGTITRLQVEEGETAIVGTMNNSGSLLLTVSDLSVMEAVIRVDETDVPDIELGDSAEIKVDAFQRQTFRGVVTEISHSSVRPPESITAGTGAGGGQAVDFEVVIRLENPPSSLRPDLSATADVITDRRTNAISIPIIALTVRDRGEVEALPQEDPEARIAAASAAGSNDVEGVFVVRDGIARFVPVTVGIAGREHFEIVAGLEVGDSVVAGPYEAIRSLMDGQAVRRLTESTTNGPLARNRAGS